MTGTIYTETVIYSPPEAFVSDAPYQIAIVTLDDARRLTCRITGERVKIGDHVTLAETRNSIPYFKKTEATPAVRSPEPARILTPDS